MRPRRSRRKHARRSRTKCRSAVRSVRPSRSEHQRCRGLYFVGAQINLEVIRRIRVRSLILATSQPDQLRTVNPFRLPACAHIEITFNSDPDGVDSCERLLPLVPSVCVELALVNHDVVARPGTRCHGVPIAAQQPTTNLTHLDMKVADGIADEVEALLAVSTIKTAIHLYPPRCQVLGEVVLSDDDPKVDGKPLDGPGKGRLTGTRSAIQHDNAARRHSRHRRIVP